MGSCSRWSGTVLGTVLVGLVSGACAVVSGLDQFEQGACTPGCDGATVPSTVSRGLEDASPEARTGDETVVAEVDATADDASSGVDGSEAQVQSAPDASADTGVIVPVEAGCGLGTVVSCSACGVACNTATGSPSCNGSTCSYACNAGRQDCNASKAPDTDGCECAGSGCCSGKCQTAHSNGKTKTFYDCNAANTHNQGQAAEACAALAGSSACSSSTAQCNCLLLFCGAPADSVCASSGGKCYCWQYSGPNAGTVQESSDSNCSASCGSNSDPTWN